MRVSNKPLDTFHDWSRLPTELKLEVLSHHLSFEGRIPDDRHRYHMSNELGRMIGTKNSELVALTIETYYTCNQFWVRIHQLSIPRSFVTYPPPKYATKIRSLVITLQRCIFDKEHDAFLHGWRFLFSQPQPLKEARLGNDDSGMSLQDTNQKWQTLFVGLKTVLIQLYPPIFHSQELFERSCYPCGLHSKGWDELKTRLADSKMGIKAKNVEVVWLFWPWIWTFNPDSRPILKITCSCPEQVNKLITQMITKNN
ncbi:hypothetical protein ACEQ8H_005220 [Pleosporales sp. CAS-2024a]